MRNVVLPDTTLAIIVRDEKENPAGDIERFLNFALPHVEAAVIVDTGSIDGIWEILQRYAGKYSHLRLFQREWNGFASSRNFSLSKVETKRALVLDADEWLSHEDYKVLAEFMRINPVWGYWFTFRLIYPNGTQLETVLGVMNPRLFGVAGVEYQSGSTGYNEDIAYASSVNNGSRDPPVQIKHFLPPEEALVLKKKNWYDKGEFLKMSPHEAAKRDGWKQENGGIYVLTNRRASQDGPTPYTISPANLIL